MVKTRKWSEQLLKEEAFKAQNESGKEVVTKKNVLHVCIGGRDMYRKAFMQGVYNGKNMLYIPFDFIVLSGDLCTSGRFYELEYSIGKFSMVYRALIQAVNPVEDIPHILGALKRNNVLPADFKTKKAWMRNDIDAVRIGHCSKDEDGEAVFYSKSVNAEDSDVSVKEYTGSNSSACLEYYRGDVREFWTNVTDDYSPVFVCGSDNVDDPAFNMQRMQDINCMIEHIDDATIIARDYNLRYFVLMEYGVPGIKNDEHKVAVSGFDRQSMDKALDAIYNNDSKSKSKLDELDFVPDVESLIDKAYKILSYTEDWKDMTLRQRMDMTYDTLINTLTLLKKNFGVTGKIQSSQD